jgi:YD repeat-containing protein
VTENQRIGESVNQETNVVTRYAYDVLGNRTVITNARAYTQSFTTYDVLGRPVIIADALGNQTFTAYRCNGLSSLKRCAILSPIGNRARGA